jgi:Flp pilus assembly protein TadD
MIAGNASDAMAAFAAVGRQVPWDPMVWTMVGETCLEMGDLRGAQEAFERALDLRPADPAALAGLLHVAIEEGSEDKAETRLRAAEAAAPRSAPVLLARARWHKASGRADEAMAAFAESLTRLHGGAAWRSRYESLASRWGIVPPNVPSTPQPTNDGAAQA